MNLSQEQQEAVRRWASEGAGLSQIQTRLAEEFGIRISYMDTRFLVIELPAAIQDRVETQPAERKPSGEDEAAAGDEDDLAENGPQDAEAGEEVAEPPAGGAGTVSVDISPLARPGFALTGSVVFSDGVKAEWGFTNDGRFALDAGKPGYRPTGEDLRQFQMQLRDIMSKRGY